jgi:DNA-binding protein HU-beta
MVIHGTGTGCLPDNNRYTHIILKEASSMTKAEIVEKIAGEIKVSKAAAAKALAVVTGSITQAMKKGDKVTLVGFGTFTVISRTARKGRNPRTGKEIKIAARKVPKFSAGAALKAVVNGKAVAKPAKKKPEAKAKKK